MLELLDLRDRRERLEPRRFEVDPSVSDTVRDILRRVRDEGDGALIDRGGDLGLVGHARAVEVRAEARGSEP